MFCLKHWKNNLEPCGILCCQCKLADAFLYTDRCGISGLTGGFRIGNTYTAGPDGDTIEVLSENNLKKDINKDGDTDDVFQLYKIKVTTTGGEVFYICPKVCISEIQNDSGIPLYDLDEEAIRLENDNKEFHIVLWVCKRTPDNDFYLYRVNEIFALENTF